MLRFGPRFAGWSFVRCQMSGFVNGFLMEFGLFSLGVYINGDIFGQIWCWSHVSWQQWSFLAGEPQLVLVPVLVSSRVRSVLFKVSKVGFRSSAIFPLIQMWPFRP